MNFLDTLQPKDYVTASIGIYAAFVASLNFAWPRLQERRERRSAVFKALQGEKEAIAEVAYKITKGEWEPHLAKPAFRKRLITALTMAFALESSDRAKAYVVGALLHLHRTCQACQEQIDSNLADIEKTYAEYDRVVDDPEFKRKRLERIRTLLAEIRKSSIPTQ